MVGLGFNDPVWRIVLFILSDRLTSIDAIWNLEISCFANRKKSIICIGDFTVQVHPLIFVQKRQKMVWIVLSTFVRNFFS